MNFDVHDAKASKRSGACKTCWNWTAVCYSFKFLPCFMHYINLNFSEWKVSKRSLTVRLKSAFLPKLQEDLRVSSLWDNSADVCHVYASGLVIHFKNLPPSVIELWQLHDLYNILSCFWGSHQLSAGDLGKLNKYLLRQHVPGRWGGVGKVWSREREWVGPKVV